jgi:hypothetical protein
VPSISSKRLIQILSCFIFPTLLFIALSKRIIHAYLEDDLLWFVPFIAQLLAKNSLWGFLKVLHTGELSFLYGAYFSALISVFGFNFSSYVVVSIVIHCINTALLYTLLKRRIQLTSDTSFLASLMYFAFYGHFHTYTWPLAAHHLLVTFFLFFILCLYFKTNEFIERGQYFTKWYWATLLFSALASFQRLSILIIPLIIFIHILFSTRENKKILVKYNLWIPLFVIFLIYPLIVLALGGQGDVLSGFLSPLYDVFGTTRNPLAICVIVTFGLSWVFIIKFLLKLFLRNKPSDFLFHSLGKLSFVILLMPQVLSFYLYIFLWPVQSALSDDALMRWQGIASPLMGSSMIVGLVFVVVIMLCFLKHMIKSNRQLIIFIPWYMMVVLYLSGQEEFFPSRYLIYATPIFSVMFCFFFIEVLPKLFSDKMFKRYIRVFYAFVFLILTANIASIGIRLDRTWLVDYHWGYDYIKIANLIKQDVQNQGGKSYALDSTLCVSGVKDIPYKQSWEKGFLREFDFTRYDSLRQVLASVFHSDPTDFVVLDECPDVRFSYRVTDFTVLGRDGESLEPFYRSFHQGLKFLKEGNDLKAIALLEDAVEQKPFVIRFMMDSFIFKWMSFGFLRQSVADIIYETYAWGYDGDEKMDYIDNMVQIEAQDYGMALAVLSYLKGIRGEQQKDYRLLKESSFFASKENIIEYPLDRYLLPSGVKDFHDFIENNDQIFLSRKRIELDIHVESYKGFNMFWHKDFYFGLPQEEGDFSLAKFKNKLYKHSFSARTKREIRKWVDSVLVNGSMDQKKMMAATFSGSNFDYKGFKVRKSGDMYVCSFPERMDGIPVPKFYNLKGDFLFQARSYPEVKLTIDAFLHM